jgi:uncharacterized protein involved in type VI secretion and phage assembly
VIPRPSRRALLRHCWSAYKTYTVSSVGPSYYHRPFKSTDLDLSLFIGEELTVAMLQPDGSRRAWHGICTEASWLGADGGVARYRLRLEPALALLALRRDSYIFQDKNARDIITELLTDYPQVRFEFDVTQELAARPVCTQYRESDLDSYRRTFACVRDVVALVPRATAAPHQCTALGPQTALVRKVDLSDGWRPFS